MHVLHSLQSTGVLERASPTVSAFLNRPLFTIGQTPVTAMTLATFVLIAGVTWVLSRLGQRGTKRAFALRGVTDLGTVAIAARLVSYVIILLGMGIALQTLGINLGALFTAGAFFAVALGFAMQNVAQNFVSGIILLSERTIKPGDVLEVEGRVVRVTHMGMRATVARTRDDEDLIIPNSTLVTNTVTNYTLRDTDFRLRASVGVSYGSDLALVMKVLREAAGEFPQRHQSYEPTVLLTEFGDSSVNFEVSVWTRDPWKSRKVLSELHETIWWALKKSNITIPFPQRDVHVISVPPGVSADGRP